MKIYNLRQLSDPNPNGEYLLGGSGLDCGAVTLLYGRLRPGEAGRKITAAEGYEEIICVIKGSVKVRHGKVSFSVNEGEAFHSKEAQSFLLDNPFDSEAVYIAASGRSLEGAIKAKGATQQDDAPKTGQKTAQAAAIEDARIKNIAEEPEYEITREDALSGETGKAGR